MGRGKRSTKEAVISGLVWTYAERMGAQLVSIVVSVILARLIAPKDYGAIAIVTIFTGLANTFVTSGFGNALIQKKDADELDFSTVFFFSIFLAIICSIGLILFAPIIASFYDLNILVPVLRVMALGIPIAAVESVQQAYVSRRMEFKKFFYSTLSGTIVSAIVGIAMAYGGLGIWALVFQALTNSLVNAIVLFFTSGWKPQWKFSFNRMKGLFSYGWKILVTSLMNALYADARELAIGKKYTAVELAYNNKGRQFPMIIATNVNTSISKVLFPVIANVQDDLQRVKQMTRRAISVGSYVLTPCMIGLAVVSPSFVTIVLSDSWMGCVSYMRIMCLVYMLQPIQTASVQAMKAIGKSGTYLKLEIIKKIFGVIVLAFTLICFDDVYAVVVGALVAELFSTFMNFPANKRLFNYSYKEQLGDLFSNTFVSVVMGIFVYAISRYITNVWILLFVQLVCGGIIYIVLSEVLKLESYRYIKGMMFDKLKVKIKR